MPDEISKEEIAARQPCELLAEILANRESGNCTMEGGNELGDLLYAAREAGEAITALLNVARERERAARRAAAEGDH